MPLYKLTYENKPPEFPPKFAHSWGEDIYGLWITVSIFGVDQTFRWCPPGEFMMGSPDNEIDRDDNEKQHKVILTRGFWLAETACTQELWGAVIGENQAYFKDTLNPAENVSFEDCSKFLDKVNSKLPELGLRLPSEAEWEYACRAGTTTPFSFGKNIRTDQANFNGESSYADGAKGEDRDKTVPVKSLPCNDWGFFEMHGNVWEWCADKYQEDISAFTVDPLVTDGERFVVRGGSWRSNGQIVRSAIRYWGNAVDRLDIIGFRFALGHMS